MLGTATKSEQDTLIEQMNAEIARLREELSRAAVREGELVRSLNSADAVAVNALALLPGLEPEVAAVYRRILSDARSALATPFPLSDAAQEVLEAAVELISAEEERSQLQGFPDGHEIRLRHDYGRLPLAHGRLHTAVDRYLALLEGRDRKEG